MIRRIQALNYRCLRYVDLSLDRFHVLVGPNASGKSTLFDVMAFMGDVIREGVGAAMEKRTENFQDLVWKRPKRNMSFELAFEIDVPDNIKEKLPPEKDDRVFRYEIAIRESDNGWKIDSERGLLMPGPYRPRSVTPSQVSRFPDDPDSIPVAGWSSVFAGRTRERDTSTGAGRCVLVPVVGVRVAGTGSHAFAFLLVPGVSRGHPLFCEERRRRNRYRQGQRPSDAQRMARRHRHPVRICRRRNRMTDQLCPRELAPARYRKRSRPG